MGGEYGMVDRVGHEYHGPCEKVDTGGTLKTLSIAIDHEGPRFRFPDFGMDYKNVQRSFPAQALASNTQRVFDGDGNIKTVSQH